MLREKKGERVQRGAVYDAYHRWALEHHHEPMRSVAFYQELKDQIGLQPSTVKGKNFWKDRTWTKEGETWVVKPFPREFVGG